MNNIGTTDDALDTTQDWDSSSYSHATGGYVDTSFMSAARKGVLSSDEEDGEESDGSGQGDSEDDLEGGMHVRRSKRVTKGQRFQFWKNERSVYVEVGGGVRIRKVTALHVCLFLFHWIG